MICVRDSDRFRGLLRQCRLKYWTSRSCCFAFSIVAKVPRLRRLPVEASFLREYKRNWPDLSFRIIGENHLSVLGRRFCRRGFPSAPEAPRRQSTAFPNKATLNRARHLK